MKEAEDQVLVSNTSGVNQYLGIYILPVGETTMIPLRLLDGLREYVEVLAEPGRSTISIYRGYEKGEDRDTLCRPACGHSLCSLTRGLTQALRAQGARVERHPWRNAIDHSVIGKARVLSSGSFEGPRGRFSWPHPDADILPAQQVDYLEQQFQGHICSSNAIRQALIASGIAAGHCHVVNDAIDVNIFQPDGMVADLGGDSFVFLMLGALNPRKGFDLALEAYGQAFTADDDVVLVLKDYDYGWGRKGWCQELIAAWKKRLGNKAPRIEYVYDTWDSAAIAAAYRRAAKHGAYLMPSRCEGFGLTGLEALACGCRLGVTGWSGQLDYATPENATLFGYTLSRNEANPDSFSEHEQPHWADAKVPDMVAWMRRMVREPADREKQARISEDVRGRFTYERMAQEMAAAIGLEGLGGGAMGALASAVGWPVYFVIATVIAVPGLVLLLRYNYWMRGAAGWTASEAAAP